MTVTQRMPCIISIVTEPSYDFYLHVILNLYCTSEKESTHPEESTQLLEESPLENCPDYGCLATTDKRCRHHPAKNLRTFARLWSHCGNFHPGPVQKLALPRLHGDTTGLILWNHDTQAASTIPTGCGAYCHRRTSRSCRTQILR